MRANKEALTRLALTFPTLRGVPGTDPFDPIVLARQLGSPARTNASGNAILFVLSVWNPRFQGEGVDLEKTPFNVHDAMQCWDDPHREAFLNWVAAPFWA